MKPQKIINTKEDWYQDLYLWDSLNLIEVISKLQEYHVKILQNGWENADIRFLGDYDGNGELVFTPYRMETNEEMELRKERNRIANEKRKLTREKNMKAKEAREYEQYKKLKQKFGD